MKFLPKIFLACALAVLAFSCKQNAAQNQAAESQAAQNVPLNNVKVDTAFGIPGCDRLTMRYISSTEMEFVSQHFTVRTAAVTDAPGESLIISEAGKEDFLIPNSDAYYFNGMSGDFMFVDQGTSENGRHVLVYDLKNRLRSFDTEYCDTLRIVGQRLWFYKPVSPELVTKMPNCPQKAEWEKAGLGVGYGQLNIFSFVERALVTKPGFKCYPMQ